MGPMVTSRATQNHGQQIWHYHAVLTTTKDDSQGRALPWQHDAVPGARLVQSARPAPYDVARLQRPAL